MGLRCGPIGYESGYESGYGFKNRSRFNFGAGVNFEDLHLSVLLQEHHLRTPTSQNCEASPRRALI